MSNRRVIPGLGLSLGYTITYLTLLVLIPLGALVLKTTQLTWAEFYRIATDVNVVASIKLSFKASAIAAAINGVFGVIVAWVLVRYRFPGKRFLDGIVDLPFALPTAVAGLTLGNLYSQQGLIGGLGGKLEDNFPAVWSGLSATWNFLIAVPNTIAHWAGSSFQIGQAHRDFLVVGNETAAIVVALIFVGMPFVIRTVQPVLQDWEAEIEQAALSLGATRWTIFRRLIAPEILPAWLSGLALAFARSVGEYGSVVFMAGNIPGLSQIAPQQIMARLEDYKYADATAIAVLLLSISLVVLLLINGLDWWSRRREQAG